MALGNWITSVINEKGEPIHGQFQSRKSGVMIEVYKNWLYVHDKRGWHKDGHFTKPVVMQVNDGTVIYRDVNIYAVRGPRHGMYFVVWTQTYPNGKPSIIRGMAGVACYAFIGNKEVPVTLKQIEYLKKQIHIGVEIGAIPEEVEKWSFRKAAIFNG